MTLSLFDLFKIGIGPSSSHTVGPMVAARRFVEQLSAADKLAATQRVRVDLYGSLALTGKGHSTDKAVILGLMGEAPELIDPTSVEPSLAEVHGSGELRLAGKKPIAFHAQTDILFNKQTFLAEHANGLSFTAYDAAGMVIHEETCFSIGGGIIYRREDFDLSQALKLGSEIPYPFANASELEALCDKHSLTVADLMRANEAALHPGLDIDARLQQIWDVMSGAIERGCRASGTLPGPQQLRRRAPALYAELSARAKSNSADQFEMMDWVSLYAMAVNEENAAGGRVVTAPTNGAAGVIPAVLNYYLQFSCNATDEGVAEFLLTAGAVGLLYQRNASISAAEVGCQGEIGVACSMAAAGLCAVLGGTVGQIENAAEIGMEHNLGLTCDPIGGLVQVPCIERNTMGAVKAINAARLALRGDGKHLVSLDSVISTMLQTGRDMQSNYKETSLGGLAVNVVAC